ncbi:MAG: hypothetical protein LM572_00345 [Ignisphaera sp.]|nr:hypothetical protein [Ignisphaera sp.]MCC6055136.1 hypothetical protein [Desulfurococcaceae archaeon]
MASREKLMMILTALKDRIVSPSDVIASTGLPRYEVLASFHILEALNIIEAVYVRGNYKLYKLSELGKKLLDALANGKEFDLVVKSSEGLQTPSNTVHNIAEATA